MMRKKEEKKIVSPLKKTFSKTFKWIKTTVSFIRFALSATFTLLIFLMLLGFLSMLAPLLQQKTGNIEIIPIQGIIVNGQDSSLLGQKILPADSIIKELKQANKNNDIKAIILQIDSPGGAPVASYDIANAIKKMNKPTIAVIGETGASGAYWVATATNKIYANPMSITGSIGVVASHLEFAGLLTKYNITYRRLVAGKYKDTGTPYKEMTTEEQALYQKLLDKLHEQFINAVAKNRKLPIDTVRQLADGFIFLGSEAKEKGLIDELGGTDEAISYLEQTLNITAQPFEYQQKTGILNLLTGMLDTQSFWFGQGFASAITTQTKTSITI